MDPRELVVHYHDRTKHHPQRYARSSGYLDWATQPDPFRRFFGAELIPLPPLHEDDTLPFSWLYEASRVKPAPLTAGSLSRFFECSLALSAWKEHGGTRWALRTNPSSGNLHPTEGYLITGPIKGISAQAGVFHYAPKEHGLEQRTTIDQEAWEDLIRPLPAGSFFIGLSSVLWREAWKYGERAFRYCQHDVGHALGALRFAAALLGRRLVVLEDLADAEMACLLGLDRTSDFEGAEPEHPDLIAAVFPNDHEGPADRALNPGAVSRVADGPWAGRANTLSGDHVEWEIIDRVAHATVKEPTPGRAELPSSPKPQLTPTPPQAAPAKGTLASGEASAHRIIRQRRSAVAFDGATSIEAGTLFHVLNRVMPHRTGLGPLQVPWDSFSWSPRVHLLLFVHRVTPLPPGVYILLRDPERLSTLKTCMKGNFAWGRVEGCPDDLPLYLLLKADCRNAAARLSLGQGIAGDSTFSLGMIADFERSLEEFGPWFYKRLFWEAGVVGQVLYLEAEVAGIRATGIGAYFDDWVHEVVGLTGHAFQSLYHFTMGGPVHDARLSTLPAYSWSNDPPDPFSPGNRGEGVQQPFAKGIKLRHSSAGH